MKATYLTAVAMLCFVSPLTVGDEFYVYAPSRSTESLIVVKAEPEEDRLTLTEVKRVDLGFAAATITTHPEKRLLYVATNRTGEESPGAIVSLDQHGKYQRHAPLKLHHGYSYISTDRSGRFLLGANYREGQVDVYTLDDAGGVGKRVSALDEGRRNAHCVLPSPDNKFVYIPYVKDTNAIYQYAFDGKTGKLTPLDPKNAGPPADTGPRHMAYHPKLPIVYFSNEQHRGVSVYQRGESGQLNLMQVGAAVDEEMPMPGLSSSDIVITPDGKYLFTGIRGHQRGLNGVSRYLVQSNGKVRPLGVTLADANPWGLTLSPDGKYLLVSAFGAETLTAYSILGDGGLKKAGSLTWDKQVSDLVTVR